MFFNRRKKFNGDVAALLADFGIDVRTSPFAVLEVLDHAWLKRFNVNEGALLVAYSYAAGLYARDVAQADLFTMGRLYPAQLEWL